MMKVLKRFVLGEAQTNCYLLQVKQEIVLIDAGDDSERIIDYIQQHKLQLSYIFLTHTHYDHIAGLKVLVEAYPQVKIYVPQAEIPLLKDSELNLANLFNLDYTYQGPVEPLTKLDCPKFGVELAYISGHSKQSAVFKFNAEKIVFSGDTLFKEGIGRSDLIYGDHQSLVAGIRQHLMTLTDDFIVYPGHGFRTTIKDEKLNNSLI